MSGRMSAEPACKKSGAPRLTGQRREADRWPSPRPTAIEGLDPKWLRTMMMILIMMMLMMVIIISGEDHGEDDDDDAANDGDHHEDDDDDDDGDDDDPLLQSANAPAGSVRLVPGRLLQGRTVSEVYFISRTCTSSQVGRPRALRPRQRRSPRPRAVALPSHFGWAPPFGRCGGMARDGLLQ